MRAAYDSIADWYEEEFFPLPALLHAYLSAGLILERFAESGGPVPVVLAVRARRPG
jgi:hypothetical protein